VPVTVPEMAPSATSTSVKLRVEAFWAAKALRGIAVSNSGRISKSRTQRSLCILMVEAFLSYDDSSFTAKTACASHFLVSGVLPHRHRC
jgi:hypothetical protein